METKQIASKKTSEKNKDTIYWVNYKQLTHTKLHDFPSSWPAMEKIDEVTWREPQLQQPSYLRRSLGLKAGQYARLAKPGENLCQTTTKQLVLPCVMSISSACQATPCAVPASWFQVDRFRCCKSQLGNKNA